MRPPLRDLAREIWVLMKTAESQLRGVDDPRLAIHATSSLPVWLWSLDGTRILWANPVGARLFAAANTVALRQRSFGPADPHRRQVAQLTRRLPPSGAFRLERLRGFGAMLGALVTCACARLEFDDGVPGILIAAREAIGRPMPLIDRLRGLVDGVDVPMAAFARDGLFVDASQAARALLGFSNLSQAGLDQARNDALALGRSETPIGVGHIVLQRVGAGADIGLVAMLASTAPTKPPSESATAPDTPHKMPADDVTFSEALVETGEAPAEYALKDEAPAPPPETAADVEKPADIPTADTATTLASTTISDATSPAIMPTVDILLPRQEPLRFIWQIDAGDNFSISSDEFIHLIGPDSAIALGRRWSEIAARCGLDGDGRFATAIASHTTFSSVPLDWPVDGHDARLRIELSGLPLQDRDGHFIGYRGFGICRDLETLTQIAAKRRARDSAPASARPLSADSPSTAALAALEVTADGPAADDINPDEGEQPSAPEIEHQAAPDTPVETPSNADAITPSTSPPGGVPENVLPFRPATDPRSPALTPVENSAFNELARQLSARLDTDAGSDAAPPAVIVAVDEPAQPDWLSPPAAPAQGKASRDKVLLDLMPVGVLIYRLDRLLYANRAFLDRIGHGSLASFEEAGGLDALLLDTGASPSSSTSETGTQVSIVATEGAPDRTPTPANLFTIEWDGASAMALIFANRPLPVASAPAIAADQPSAVGDANAEELGAIIDTTAEGVVMFDGDGRISCCNRSAEALFGYAGSEMVERNLTDLVAAESQRVVQDYLDGVKRGGVGSLDHGREALGRVREGGLFPLAMTIGRTRADGPNFFAVFRDLTQAKKTESELLQARRAADRAASAKADVLAKISHEIRTPLNAILGFADVMIEQRFGAIGNDRYIEYMKDIRASGERVIAIVNDLLDLSRIETGQIDLAFTSQDLNDLVEHSVAVMQPQANRERIIIRTSLAHLLPPVVADAQALRQIVLNLIGTSIHLANAGGQVIVSTALSDAGEVMLRVRDTGHRLNEDELAAAMEPFGSSPPSDHAAAAGVSLSLTKALIEANRAQFHIKSAPHSGSLIEVVFAQASARV